MNRTGWSVAVAVAVALLAGGCTATSAAPPATPATVAAPVPRSSAAAVGDAGGDGRGGRHGGSGGGQAAAPTLPADWPADVPAPPGPIQGSGRSPGVWTVLVVLDGSDVTARRTVIDFYKAAGFVADTDSTVHRGYYRITVVGENRDHSATRSNVAISLAMS